MLAPNGKPTKLNERQWLQARTPEFKAWFGDWELKHKFVDIVKGKKNTFNNFDEAKEWAKANIAKTYSNKETGGKGEIRISNNAISKYLSESAIENSDSKDIHLSVLKVLPDVIREGIDAERHADYLKKDGIRKPENGINENVTIHRIYEAVDIDGEIYRVKVTIKRDITSKNPQTPHSYEATKIELLAGTLVNSDNASLYPNTNSSKLDKNGNTVAKIQVTKLLKGIEKSYEKGKLILDDHSKVVDENGEPMAVYHGTNQNFDKFNKSKLGKNTTAKSSIKFFFTENPKEAEEYANLSANIKFQIQKK